jgi:hypothetical protein
MTEQQKLILAQLQIDNLLSLLKGNAYESYMCGKLYGIKYEVERQLTNISHSSKISKEN